MARFDLSDAEWSIIAPLLPNKPRGVPRTDDRRVLNGIFYILRTGSPWRDLPERYGPYTTVYNRFNRWAKAGVWVSVFNALADQSPESMTFIDSSIIRAHQHAAGGKKGGPDHAIGLSRGGLSTKIHAIVDDQGLPIRLALSQGQAGDKSAGAELISTLRRARHVVADRGYDARALVEQIEAMGATAHIPTQKKLQGPAIGRAAHLSPTQSRRALLLQTQALQTMRHTIRKAGQKLPGRHRTRISKTLDQSL